MGGSSMPENAMLEFAVPVVDLSPYVGGGSPEARADTARRLDDACRTVGFVQIVGHGVPDAVIEGLKGAIDAFFGLDLDVKKGFRAPPRINRGYTPPRSESLSLSLGVEAADRMNDFFEAFNVGVPASAYPGRDLPADDYAPNLWPEELPEFRESVEAYFAEAARVARTLTTVFADALGLDPGYFAAFTGHSLDVLRMNNYALPPGEVVLDGDLTGMGEHTDYGIVTVLWADREAGLQVLGQDGGWHDVMPAEGALLVNLGDLMARWTNDAWTSTLHRVKPPVVDGAIRRRRSAAYFHDGNIDAIVSTLPSLEGTGTPYPPITVADHIRAKLGGSREGVSNPYADREAARVRAAVT
ncbi:isopenicillin N synthase family dioxygenase [Actinocorallia sp. A-T 12471]|uniref:isopenicillin N synthase family dioxygenase n=1 Tax=Actinocorallia sp. A-T 12471 TaxID=3089813 RepID=UPI0029D047C1|nr:2-oxoglutarate and iron-dependent oxygenase domain-containing protein [Actinocorallia sp. A-T 12471]MDX6739162.1 2-oxoglutarate and iron-dependent oxygenase domain-containing protein [Actinocorallia sp. A-T 12471]